MNIINTGIEGLLIVEPKIFGDSRGYFFEVFNRREFAAAVADVNFVQDNESKSGYGVLRGLHYQKAPYAQTKLVRVVKGRVLDVAVDIRPGSKTFGKHFAIELSEQNKRMMFIPKGFAHGYLTLAEENIFQYKCDEFYHPEAEAGLAWDDPTLAIPWPLPEGGPILSEKDRHHPGIKDIEI